jgi:hypothetical protein
LAVLAGFQREKLDGTGHHRRINMRQVEIRVKGQIDETWSDWFEGLAMTHTEEGETVLAGPVVDEAAMYGLLVKIRDLGLQLLSVNRTD